MRSSSRTHHDTLRRSAVVLLALIASVEAHSVHRARGRAVIGSDRVEVSFEISVEDFFHRHGLYADADRPVSGEMMAKHSQSYTDELDSALEIWDEFGNRAIGSGFRLAESSPLADVSEEQLRGVVVRMATSYAIRPGAKALTLRMNTRDGQAGPARQWVVEVVAGGSIDRRWVLLTSRGNAETLALEWDGDVPRWRSAPDAMSEGATCTTGTIEDRSTHHEIVVGIEATSTEILGRAMIPLPIVEEWHSIRRSVEGRVEVHEQDAFLTSAKDEICESLRLLADRSRVAFDACDCAILGAGGGSPRTDADGRAVGFFSAHLEVRWRFAHERPIDGLSFEWNLLNPTVPFAGVTFREQNHCETREFSTYSPRISWPRPSKSK